MSVTVTASKEGSFTLKDVQFRYNGSLKCTEDLIRQGARLFATKAQMLEPTYAEDSTLKILVKPPQPILQVVSDVPINDIYSGETVEIQMSLENAGSRSLKDLRVLCDTPQTAFEVAGGASLPPIGSLSLTQQVLDRFCALLCRPV